ncbi:MAG: hypothetical protein HYV63_00160 [Candidatus Schekmanbacteria bacterium]|nr:hypothetical protein [Candidatus Schekmanbacteria bacterium]
MPELLRWFVGGGDRPSDDLSFESLLLAGAAASGPTVFTYHWRSPALVLGYGQSSAAFAENACRELGIPIVRRVSGGLAVLNEGSPAVSLVIPGAHPWAEGIVRLYQRFQAALLAVLSPWCPDLTPDASPATPAARAASQTERPSLICFEGRGPDGLSSGGRKVVGGAQARRRYGALVHAVLQTRCNARLQARVFGVSAARIAATMTTLPAPGDGGDLAAAVAARLAQDLGLRLLGPLQRPAFSSPDALEPILRASDFRPAQKRSQSCPVGPYTMP